MLRSLFGKTPTREELERDVNSQIESMARSGHHPPPAGWTVTGGMPASETPSVAHPSRSPSPPADTAQQAPVSGILATARERAAAKPIAPRTRAAAKPAAPRTRAATAKPTAARTRATATKPVAKPPATRRAPGSRSTASPKAASSRAASPRTPSPKPATRKSGARKGS